MKQSPHDLNRGQLFGPTKFSGDGFLGTDSRTVEEIIAEDARTCAGAGLTPQAIADGLEAAYLRAESAFGEVVTISPRGTAWHIEAKGRLPSPFGAEGTYPKGEVMITDTATGVRMYASPLSIHLIRAHGFFQGRGCRYRLEPAEIAATLGLVAR